MRKPSAAPDLAAVGLIAAVWALVVALVGLGGDYALNDDWAYAWTARHLLQTGKLRILDWAAPSLATHALWGAGVLRLFGDSYVALRGGTLVWALGALLALYGLARTVLAPRAAVVVPLALGLSPWFVCLAFSYMTDVPWLAMLLTALLAFTRALDPGSSRSPNPALLVLSGALIGAAATTRQYAVITTPAFALVLLLDARRRARVDGHARWLWPAVRDSLFFGAPAAAIFFPFYHWYTHVHGATQANRDTVAQMLSFRPWQPFVHALCAFHYAGLWLFPLALAALFRRRLGDLVTRRQGLVALVLLGGYAVARPLMGPLLNTQSFDYPAIGYHPLMPYLGNLFYLVGLGAPTTTDVYWGYAPMPHTGIGLGVVLTLASTLGGVAGAGILVAVAKDVRRAFAGEAPPPDEAPRRRMLRVLLVFFGGLYLLFQLFTSTFVFDRYLVPLLPLVILLGVDAVPSWVPRAPAVAVCLVLSGVFAIAGTHEYLSWNGARDRAFRDLVARGVPATDIDGGFEVNAPIQFEAYRKRTGALLGDGFWIDRAPYRISFWPSRTPDCTTQERYPYWTWPGGGDRAMYVLRCSRPAASADAR